MQKWAFVDLETTGGSFDRDRVIEVGIVVMENGAVTETYSTLVNPERSVPETILGLTGINEADLPTAPLFSEVALHVKDLLDGALFVAHNARFDKGFLKAEFARLGIAFNPPSLCTVRLSRRLFPEYRRHNLDELIARFSIDCENRHRALDDAQVLVEFLGHVRARFSEEELERAIKIVTGERSVPPALDQELVRSLPEKPGVYIFYSQEGLPIYVGKGLNIRTSALSHFNPDVRSSKDRKMAQLLHQIEVIETAGELGALLMEFSLIKKLSPLYKRTRRLSTKNSSFDPWPYTGAVAIEEKDGQTGRGEVFVIDQWRILARGSFGEFGICFQKSSLDLGLEESQLLRSFLKNHDFKGKPHLLSSAQVEEILNDFSY